MVLAGVNTYSAGTVISGGVLQLDGTNTASGSNVIAVNAGALSGTGTANNAVVVAAGAHLAPGDNVFSTQRQRRHPDGRRPDAPDQRRNLDMALGTTSASSLVVVNGDLDIQGATLNVQASCRLRRRQL